MSESGQSSESRIPFKARTLAAIGAGALTLAASTVKAGGWEGLSHVLTLAYQLAWVALVCHHYLHLCEGYLWVGLARPTACEFGLVVAWGLAAAFLGEAADPKFVLLAACWLPGAALLFLSGTDMERARKKLKDETGYRAKRATDVIRASDWWGALCSRFAQVEDEKVDELRERLSQRDTDDGYLSSTTWAACCSTLAVGLIAVAGAFGSTVLPLEEQLDDGGGGRGSDGAPKETERPPDTAPSGEKTGTGGPPADEKDCNGLQAPTGAPEESTRSLTLTWREVEGLVPGPMEALGYDIAGCPTPAHPIPGLPGSWYAAGYCGGSLRVISIALAGYDHPIALLEQVAEFAMPMIREGRFVSAEDRFEVGDDGDAYVIVSRDGTFVPIRDDTTAGPVDVGDRGGKGGCNDYVDKDVAYTVAGPGLIEGWRAVAAISPGGVYPIAYGAHGDEVRIALRSTAVGIVTVARCTSSLLACDLPIAGTTRHWSEPAEIEQDEVKALAEP